MSDATAPVPPQRRILQIGYYENLIRTRAAMLQRAGYCVASVIGNEQAKASAAELIPGTDLVFVGFSGPYAERLAIARWIKKEYPGVPLIVLQVHSSERFPEADSVSLSEDPQVWLAAVAACLERTAG